MAELREAVRNQAIAPCKQTGSELWGLPAGKVGMDPIKKRRIVVERIRERLEQVCRPHHIRDTSERVAFKCNGSI